jgi:GTP cyclohydrolase I
VIVKAAHQYMITRGAHGPGSDLVTRVLNCSRENVLTRQEFLGMVT